MEKFRTNELTIDFVAEGENPSEWMLILIEKGPWPEDSEAELFRLQNRLYDCLDVILDGKIAGKFPLSKNANIKIRLDCYNVKKSSILPFFNRFSANVLETKDYSESTKSSEFVTSISFEITFDSIH